MNASEFAAKWSASSAKESAGAKEHFIDLCRMLGYATPNEADPAGDWYAFEKGAGKTEGGDGFADVWKRGHFAWEYKGKRKDLKAAYSQLLEYREALENPPLLVVCDLDRFEVHTNFTGTVKEVHAFDLDELATAPERPIQILRALMGDPERLRPQKTPEQLTEEAAREFAALAVQLRELGHDPQTVAHFLDKLLFCLFAEDAGLLPKGLIGRLTDALTGEPDVFAEKLTEVFSHMSTQGGGHFGAERIEWFNGSLFDGADVIPLEKAQIEIVGKVAKLDWAEIEPAIFGTLFERGLDPDSRTRLGAHYTDRQSIERLVQPVLMAPLRREFDSVKADVLAMTFGGQPLNRLPPAKRRVVEQRFEGFLDQVRSVTVLDPACGSGNFLYVALQALKDLEREALLWASLTLRLPMQFPRVGPHQLKGIEISPYAAELTRVTIWIGEIQWMLRNGFAYLRDPILRPLENIETRDALIDWSDAANPAEAAWPNADVIVGNPPFLGGKLLRGGLGDGYVETLFHVFERRVPPEADFVTYWHEKARSMVTAGETRRVGLLATQGIRGGANRRVIERIKESGNLFMAWSDEPWVLNGANVHVSFLAFDDGTETERTLDGLPVESINSNLTAGIDLTQARRLSRNTGIAFQGPVKIGPFDIDEDVAQQMLGKRNPDGRSNADVVRPFLGASDITGRSREMWIIDFPYQMARNEAALYEAPFEYVNSVVRPVRATNRRARRAEQWWRLGERSRDLRAEGLSRYIATPRVSKHRVFIWADAWTLPDSSVVAIARDDYYTFGILHSRVHERWARRTGTQLREAESGFRYTPRTTFETFAFPQPTGEQRVVIGDAALRLHELRMGWLSPPDVEPDELEMRTLTNLYNEPPTWLRDAHATLDTAVLTAYGWPANIDDDDLLARLLELNLRAVNDRQQTAD